MKKKELEPNEYGIMRPAIKYHIHFGKKKFKVNEWLYDYFNSVKEKPRLYRQLFNILTGVK